MRDTLNLAEHVPLRDKSVQFGQLVGSEDLRSRPVHRWFSYKEGFSPDLLSSVITELDLTPDLRVIDVFGGVATTAIAGLADERVSEVRSLEYSPLAHFVGRTKLRALFLDASRLRKLLPRILAYDHRRSVHVPELSAFHNGAIFPPSRIRTLIAVRDHIQSVRGLTATERDFFLLGLASVLEDLSGAMKDGRALRIKRTRRRRRTSLSSASSIVPAQGTVKRALAGQWSAMIQDLESAEVAQQTGYVHHLQGDARDLAAAPLLAGKAAFPDSWAELAVFSPPYLNCVDYTEVYKLELWLLEQTTSSAEFRNCRLGTLRSHPSVRFAERPYFEGLSGPVVELARNLAQWITNHGSRSEVGPVIRQYFEDMIQTFREQLRVLKPGGIAVCVVANSTFSRRDRVDDGTLSECWRLPILTDVVLAHLATLAGFKSVEIWEARELRPRNVQQGRARESLVVAKA